MSHRHQTKAERIESLERQLRELESTSKTIQQHALKIQTERDEAKSELDQFRKLEREFPTHHSL